MLNVKKSAELVADYVLTEMTDENADLEQAIKSGVESVLGDLLCEIESLRKDLWEFYGDEQSGDIYDYKFGYVPSPRVAISIKSFIKTVGV